MYRLALLSLVSCAVAQTYQSGPSYQDGGSGTGSNMPGYLPDYQGDKYTNPQRIKDTQELNKKFFDSIGGPPSPPPLTPAQQGMNGSSYYNPRTGYSTSQYSPQNGGSTNGYYSTVPSNTISATRLYDTTTGNNMNYQYSTSQGYGGVYTSTPSYTASGYSSTPSYASGVTSSYNNYGNSPQYDTGYNNGYGSNGYGNNNNGYNSNSNYANQVGYDAYGSSSTSGYNNGQNYANNVGYGASNTGYGNAAYANNGQNYANNIGYNNPSTGYNGQSSNYNNGYNSNSNYNSGYNTNTGYTSTPGYGNTNNRMYDTNGNNGQYQAMSYSASYLNSGCPNCARQQTSYGRKKRSTEFSLFNKNH